MQTPLDPLSPHRNFSIKGEKRILQITFLGGSTLLQSKVVVDGVIDGVGADVGTVVMRGTEFESVALVVLGVGVVGHGYGRASTLQDALQYPE